MIKLSDRARCCGCSACADACPHGAIAMEADGMGFRYPRVDEALCTNCGLCEKICAFKAQKDPFLPLSVEAIRFPGLRDCSQSGGLAFALMLKAVREGMVVYGAAMAGDFSVGHVRVETEEALEPLRLSKYVQSDTTGIPAQVLGDLKAGRKVLFTGTPCQCAGIGSIAGKYRENLILMDIICHGVPAPAVWKDFIASRSQKVTKALFRDPSLGWHDHRETLWYGERKEVTDNYTFLFYRNIMLRPSCGVCPFASLHRPSDITAGDCWGMDKARDDNMGWSVMLVNTLEDEAFTRDFGKENERFPIDTEKLLQPNLHAPTVLHQHSKAFERTFLKGGYPGVERRFGRDSLEYRTEQFIKKVKRHI